MSTFFKYTTLGGKEFITPNVPVRNDKGEVIGTGEITRHENGDLYMTATLNQTVQSVFSRKERVVEYPEFVAQLAIPTYNGQGKIVGQIDIGDKVSFDALGALISLNGVTERYEDLYCNLDHVELSRDNKPETVSMENNEPKSRFRERLDKIAHQIELLDAELLGIVADEMQREIKEELQIIVTEGMSFSDELKELAEIRNNLFGVFMALDNYTGDVK